MNKPRKPKAPSLAKVARTYRKNTKTEQSHTGSHFFSEGASTKSTGSVKRKNTYKPVPKQMTYGASTKEGKGKTIRKKGRI
jgi:hypothetical protein